MNRKIVAGIVILIFVAFGLQVTLGPWKKCAVYDEPHYLAIGYYNIKTGDFNFAPHNPPLIRIFSALMLLPFNLQLPQTPSDKMKEQSPEIFAYGMKFLYHNSMDADKILLMGRIPVFILSLLLGFFVFKWTATVYGENAGLLSLFLYCFSPNIIAYSGVATTDLGVAVFIFLYAYFFWRFSVKQNWINTVFLGISLGLTLVSKTSGIVLIPIGILLIISEYKKLNKNWWKLVFVPVIASFVIILSYGITGISGYFKGLDIVFSSIFIKIKKTGSPNFLMGSYSTEGWWYYFIIAYLIKTPIPTTLLLLWSLLKLKNRIRKLWNIEKFIVLPFIVFFASASISQTQLGLRYILPVYPFLFMWLGGVIKFIKPIHKKNAYIVITIFCLWYLYSAIKIFPHHLSYFNEIIGGPKNGYKYLVDSNLDWGQDMKELKKYLNKEKPANLVECYFGQGEREYYGIKGQHILTPICSQLVNYSKKGKNLLAVSATYLQGLYLGDITAFDWLKKYEPVEKIGYSIFVYDMTDSADIHYNLGKMFIRVNNTDAAFREFNEALRINPDYWEAHYNLAIIYWQKKKWDRVIVEFENVLKINPLNGEVKKYLKIAKGNIKK